MTVSRLSKIAGFGLLAAAALALSACGDTRGAFSFGQDAPDEFAVVSRAPLAIPPAYNLQPPRPGAPRPQEGTATDQARAALGGSAGVPAAGVVDGSVAERVLLSRTGGANVDDSIRSEVDRAAGRIRADENFVQRLLFWQEPARSGRIVDPEREAERLDAARREGRPLSEGEVPSIERRDGGILTGLF